MNARKIEDDTPEIAAARARLFEEACASLPPEAVYRQTPATPMVQEGLREALAEAYRKGATDVHHYWVNNPGEPPQGDPEFGEAASDYASAALDILALSATPAPPVDETDRLREAARIAMDGLYQVIDLDHHNMGPESKATTVARAHVNAAKTKLDADRTQEGEV